ncbi:MAG: exodeoxyribonuclease V subunit alpha [Planctomycetaceae bacterium]
MTIATPLPLPPLSLDAYVAAGVLAPVDVTAARMLVDIVRRSGETIEPSLIAWIGLCLALRAPRDGHTCVHLGEIAAWSGGVDAATNPPCWPGEPQPWIDALQAIPAVVGKPGDRTPFILDAADSAGGRDARLYLGQAFSEEQAIATALLRDGSKHVSILLGGPGSGKTYTLAKDLIDRFERSATPPRIALAAPTGKAAARMTKALEDRCIKAQASADVLKAVRSAPASTIHRLLKYNPDRSPQFAYGPANPLDYDLVVVDEVSMVASSLLHALLAALGPNTAIRLVGDPDQLASVEAGSVLGDIAEACRKHGSPLAAQLHELDGQHRYAADSAIARLAAAIRAGDAAAAVAALAAGTDDVTWITPGDAVRLADMAERAREHARRLRQLARDASGTADERAKRVLEAQAELQVLCARRTGSTGVSGWNQRIEKGLGLGPAPGWYSGRPIMVRENNPDLGLFNGDVGVIVPADEPGGSSPGRRRKEAVFALGDDVIRVPVTRLEDVATVHALTIHKSQGSEYGHAIVVLPEGRSRLLTRELLYTGITRAVKQVTVIGSEDVIRRAIETPIRRATGLALRLRGG